MHINQLIRGEEHLADYQIMVIPGGFTYGDDIAAGKVLANEFRLKLREDLPRFVAEGKLILGICNGFQVLAKAGFLPKIEIESSPRLTLTTNDLGRFECRWVYLGVNKSSPCIFTEGIESLYLPVAHGEGKLIALADTLVNDNIALYYTDEQGHRTAGYPYNPNGSKRNIAGVCDSSGRIFGLMPHPERHIHGTQHPQWTRLGAKTEGDGLRIFQNAVKWAERL